MNFSEFTKMLLEDPTNQDPGFLRARESSPEFKQAAAESDLFEDRLKQALSIPEPRDFLNRLTPISQREYVREKPWRHYALAASVLLAVAVAGITWRVKDNGNALDQYVSHHYSLDGLSLVTQGEGQLAENVADVLGQLQVALTQEAKSMVGFIKFCPTPAGTGAHMVLNTEQGPITVIFMPDTVVTDGKMLKFEGMQAQLVLLEGSSAVIIGTETQQVARFHGLVQNSFTHLST